MMDPPWAPPLDSACFIPPLLKAQVLVGETVRRVEYGTCLLHELCCAAFHAPGDIPTDLHTTESLALDIRGAQIA